MTHEWLFEVYSKEDESGNKVPFVLGHYQTVGQALKAQDGKPEAWGIAIRVVLL